MVNIHKHTSRNVDHDSENRIQIRQVVLKIRAVIQTDARLFNRLLILCGGILVDLGSMGLDYCGIHRSRSILKTYSIIDRSTKGLISGIGAIIKTE